MRYEWLTVRGGEPFARYSEYDRTILTTDETPPRVFGSPDEALRTLGDEGWQCIHFYQDDGYRQTIVPGSLIQARPWPKQWTIRFQREVIDD